MNYTFSDKLSQNDFDNFAQQHQHGSFFQTSGWAGVKDNWQAIYTGVYKDNKLIGACLVLKRPLVLKYSFMYAPRGPLMDFEDTELLDFYLSNLKDLSKKHKAISFTVDPYLIRAKYPMQKAMKNKVEIDYQDQIVESFNQNGFIHTGFSKDMHDTIQPRFQPTIYLDKISLAKYQKSKGYKTGVKASEGNIKSLRLREDGLDEFLEVIQKTEEAKNISLRGRSYFEKLLENFGEDSLISIAYLDLEAELESLSLRKKDMETRLKNPTIKEGRRREYESQLVSIKKELVFISEKIKERGPKVNISGLLALKNKTKAEFLYAGMDRDFLKYSGSNLNYVDTIAWASKNDCSLLSFGGSSGFFSEGIDRFKATFDPTLDEYVGEFVFENKKMLNYLFIKAQEIRKKIIHRG